jgi:hypothetical protein
MPHHKQYIRVGMHYITIKITLQQVFITLGMGLFCPHSLVIMAVNKLSVLSNYFLKNQCCHSQKHFMKFL